MSITLVLVIGLVTSIWAQQSDYEQIEDFKKTIELLDHQIENAITSQQLYAIEKDIDSLENKFRSYESFINRGIYPQTFGDMIERVKSGLIANEHRLLLIEHQREQLFDLSSQLTAYRSEMDRLYTEADSLRKEIVASHASEKRLSEMLTLYRERINERDRLVFEMIDSLLITHDNIVFRAMNEEVGQNYVLSDSENPLFWIESMLDENISFSQHQNVLLQVEDHIRMYALQAHFQKIWEQVGDDIIAIYGGENKANHASAIEEAIREWRMVSSHKMWKSINQYLEFNSIEMPAFDTPDSFFNSLIALIENEIDASENEFLSSNGYAEYLEVAEFWRSTFKNGWNGLVEGEQLLSAEEITLIDAALMEWEQESRPIHPMLVAILVIMFVSLTGFILVMARSKATR